MSKRPPLDPPPVSMDSWGRSLKGLDLSDPNDKAFNLVCHVENCVCVFFSVPLTPSLHRSSNRPHYIGIEDDADGADEEALERENEDGVEGLAD